MSDIKEYDWTKSIPNYDPKIHCCPRWQDDYCYCVKNALREIKSNSRDRNVNATLNFLKKNKINFVESKTENVVIINPDSDYVFLSLKKDGGLLKCRFKGKNKWYTYTKDSFLNRFKQNKNE
jgi:hypothetical protein